MSNTPRTDAAIVEKILCTEGGDEECTVYPVIEHVEADFARTLERENNALRADKARLESWIDWLAEQERRERKAYSNADIATGGKTWPDVVTLLAMDKDGVCHPVDAKDFRAAIDAGMKVSP